MEAPLETETLTPGDRSAQSTAVPTPDELAPLFPQLEIMECLGRGGMGVVYKARQKALDRFVALKLLAPEKVSDAAFSARFEKEALALAKLSHPNIVTVHDFGSVGDGEDHRFYLIMEFVDGVNLRQAMNAGRFTPEQGLAIVPPVCEALQSAHDQGIVHRDIKPENLLLDREGRVKIADFGIAKMVGDVAGLPPGSASLGTHSFVGGTPRYMAPEQASDPMHVDHRADIYSLGAVLYELLTGEAPNGALEPPSHRVKLDVRLDEVVLRALARTPELRFQTAGEFRTQLETVVSTAPRRPTSPAPGMPLPQQRSRRNGCMRFFVAMISLLVAIAAGLYFTWQASYGTHPSTPSPNEAERLVLAELVTPSAAFPTTAISLVIVGFVILVLSLPLILRKVPMNALYGARIPASFASEENWYAINAYAGRQLAKGSVAVILTGLVGVFIPWHRQDSYTFWAIGIVLASVLIPAFQMIGLGKRGASMPPNRSRGHKLFMSILLAVPIALFIKTFVLESFVVKGPAAEPEIPQGSYVLALKLRTDFNRGDLVIYRDSEHSHRTGRVKGDKDGRLLVERAINTPLVEVSLSSIHGKVVSVLWRSTSQESFPDSSGSVSLLQDSSLGHLEQAMIMTLAPGHVMIGELAFVDEKHSVATTYSAAEFWIASTPSKTGGEKVAIELRETQFPDEWTLDISGAFSQTLLIPLHSVATSYGTPDDPSRMPPLHLPSGSQWRRSKPKQIHHFGPGEWSANTWNEFPIFQIFEPDGTKRGELRWRLLTVPADNPGSLPSMEAVVKREPWHDARSLETMEILTPSTLDRLHALPRGSYSE